MKASIIIPTCSNPNKLEKLLNSIPSYNANNPIEQSLIVDDSPDEKSKAENKRIAQMYPSTLYINKEIFESVLSIYHSDTKNDQPNFLKLGTKEWNLNNARNIGALILYSISKQEDKIICLDDDIVFEKNDTSRISKIIKNTKPILGGFKLKGCPDLSRLEYIELYSKILASKFLKKNVNYTPSTFYVTLVADAKNSSEECIKKYTNLILEKEHHNKDTFPQRKELSGGAFIASAKLFKDSYFPDWFDEDWTWFDIIRKKNRINNCFIKDEITHLSNKKEILIKNALEFEEHGKILTNAVKASYPEFQYSKITENLKTEQEKRIKRLSNFLQYVETIAKESKEPIYENQLILIISNIKQLKDYLDNFDIPENSRKIGDYATNLNKWTSFMNGFNKWSKKNKNSITEVLKK